MRRGEVCEQKGRQGVPRVQDHGHLPRALVINPFSDIYVSDNDHRGERNRQRDRVGKQESNFLLSF